MKKADSITIPGAVDLHVHLREPSTIEAENIKSGTRAGLLGGQVLICDMPNNPGSPTWTMDRLMDKQKRIERSAYIPVATYAGSQPESNNLDELAAMATKSIGLKLYGAPTTGNPSIMRRSNLIRLLKNGTN
jgi:dihydroorotase